MTIRKIVLIPSLLVLASTAYLAFRPHTPPASPEPMPAARTAPALLIVEGPSAATRVASARANEVVPSQATHAVSTAASGTANAAAPAAPAPARVDVERVLADYGPVPALTTMGPVPAEGSGLYGAPDRLSARKISENRAGPAPGRSQGGPAPLGGSERSELGGTESRDHDVKSGDAVRIRYRMYELMSGREVESSPPEGILVRVGTGIEDSAAAAVNRVPRGVAESLGHARLGDVVEIILPKDTRDLPPDLDSTQAHKIHITVMGRY
jgi:hypothetical protein